MPLREMGGQAVDSLLALLAGEHVVDSMVATAPELIVRGSTAAR
jgi:DNA-binding LacI/PurR family transcriptional regulator